MAFRAPDLTKEIEYSWNHLPHWKQDGVTYFITFRLADSVPKDTLDLWIHERDCWLSANAVRTPDDVEKLPDHQREAYHRRFTARFHDWLDAGAGECLLGSPAASSIVAKALRHFEGERHAMEALVVMPNHVHALVTPNEGVDLSGLLHMWKSFTAHALNKRLGRSGTLWQKESYDHLVRHEEQFHFYRRYIRDNPQKAKLHEGQYLWQDALGDPP